MPNRLMLAIVAILRFYADYMVEAAFHSPSRSALEPSPLIGKGWLGGTPPECREQEGRAPDPPPAWTAPG
jgi:hypothetical protein